MYQQVLHKYDLKGEGNNCFLAIISALVDFPWSFVGQPNYKNEECLQEELIWVKMPWNAQSYRIRAEFEIPKAQDIDTHAHRGWSVMNHGHLNSPLVRAGEFWVSTLPHWFSVTSTIKTGFSLNFDYICVFTYIHIYMFIYTHIYLYTYIFIFLWITFPGISANKCHSQDHNSGC